MHSTEVQQRLALIKLLPFFVSVVFYFRIFIYYESSAVAVITKCAPIISLMYFVISTNKNENPLSQNILYGLMFGGVGDAFLIWKAGFLQGMLSFTLAHVYYIRAFGFKPLKIKLWLYLLVPALIVAAILYNGLYGVMRFVIPIYILVISMMIWRAWARIQPQKCTWIELATVSGSVLFGLSDFIIGIDQFVRPVAHAQVIIMSLYYAAQLGIALSVLQPNSL
uniref:lysoplasmalogenase n=1 Tax=Dendroctonus ponderosae TaxID=77166 RepID=A0AAR5PK63_DENPD